ncbi:hypothetical protein SELMODRAFT_417843 [Selaginella moellendorffii]|uniref:DNA topoisomerase n=1 Tax=Selaginella moellendorffii TaxID=88036 RepID=D8S3U1_SELML|nr:hypothetical protein SELMODRAFT_417843 [Selaginella moellendorffii]
MAPVVLLSVLSLDWEMGSCLAGDYVHELSVFKMPIKGYFCHCIDFPPKYQNWEQTDPLDLFGAPALKNEALASRLVSFKENMATWTRASSRRLHTQIITLVPKPFWTLYPRLSKGGHSLQVGWERGSVFEQAKALKSGSLKVLDVSQREELKARPTGLNTVNMLKLFAWILTTPCKSHKLPRPEDANRGNGNKPHLLMAKPTPMRKDYTLESTSLRCTRGVVDHAGFQLVLDCPSGLRWACHCHFVISPSKGCTLQWGKMRNLLSLLRHLGGSCSGPYHCVEDCPTPSSRYGPGNAADGLSRLRGKPLKAPRKRKVASRMGKLRPGLGLLVLLLPRIKLQGRNDCLYTSQRSHEPPFELYKFSVVHLRESGGLVKELLLVQGPKVGGAFAAFDGNHGAVLQVIHRFPT